MSDNNERIEAAGIDPDFPTTQEDETPPESSSDDDDQVDVEDLP